MMSTLTHTPETELTLPPALWRAFRAERRMGSKQRQATSMAFEKVPGYTKSDTREALAQLLFQREATDGLALSSREIEDEIERESEGVEDGPIGPEPGSTAAVRADAERRVIELEEQRRRMSVEALTDPKVKQELLDVESEIALARSTLDLADTAETEIQRREREASEAAARAAVEQAEAEAAKLQPQIAKAAQRVDTAAGVFAEAVTAFRELKELQAGAVGRTRRGGEAVRGRSFRRREAAAALYVALRERGLGDVIEKFSGDNRDTPLAAGEPKEWS